MVPNDPWGHGYIYRSPGEHAPYEIISLGSDGQEGGSGTATDIASGTHCRRVGERGFALIEILCVLAIIGLLAAIILPAIPRATSRAKLESFAVETAALLKADRSAALRRQIQVTTQIDAEARSIRSGVTGRVIRLPNDVTVEAHAGIALRGSGRRPVDRFLSVGNVVRRHDRAGAPGDGI